MSIHWWLKAMFLTAFLIAAAYFFGTVCQQMAGAHAMLLSPSEKLLTLLLRLLLVMGLMAVTAGVVAALLRPWWVAALAFVLSSLALLLGWSLSWQSAVLTLLYVLAGVIYAAMTQRELDKRTEFSVTAVSGGQLVLLTVLLIVALGSFYWGYAGYIQKEGLSIPEDYRGKLSGGLAKEVTAPLPAILREGIQSAIEQQVQYMLTVQFRQLVKPVERFIPAVAALLLFLPLLAIVYLLAWVPILVLGVVFILLRATRIVKVTTELVQVKRLAM